MQRQRTLCHASVVWNVPIRPEMDPHPKPKTQERSNNGLCSLPKAKCRLLVNCFFFARVCGESTAAFPRVPFAAACSVDWLFLGLDWKVSVSSLESLLIRNS